MNALADLSRLSRAEQALHVRCPNVHNCSGVLGARCRRESGTLCPRRYERLRQHRADLAFDLLGRKWHTGVPCGYCRVPAGEYCLALNVLDETPAHPSRVEASVRLASRLRDDYTGALLKEV